MTVSVGKTDLLIDLGAERIVAAERDGERIAIEIKSFVKLSLIQDLKETVGQFVIYEGALAESEKHAGRTLYLAIRNETYDPVFEEPIGEMLLRPSHLRLIAFDPDLEVVTLWNR